MAAAAPPVGAGAPPAVPPVPAVASAPSAPVLTFLDRYRDCRFDAEGGNYLQLLSHFDPMSPNHFTPVQLLDAVLQEPDDNSRAIVMHWQDPSQPDNPGELWSYMCSSVIPGHLVVRPRRGITASIVGSRTLSAVRRPRFSNYPQETCFRSLSPRRA
jgi:hypothetical protein